MNIYADSVQFLKGVGPQRAERLRKLGVTVCFDLFWLLPHSYLNRSRVTPVAALRDDGELYHIKGHIVNTQGREGRRGRHLFRAWVQDGSGAVEALWFNQPYLSNILKPGMDILLSGKLKSEPGRYSFMVSDYAVEEPGEEAYPVLPIYPLTAGLNQKWLRGLMRHFLTAYAADYPELLSAELRAEHHLCAIAYAWQQFHFPAGREEWKAARRRLAVEELTLYRLGIAVSPAGTGEGYIRHSAEGALRRQVQAGLPFALTAGQEQALAEIIADMTAPRKMNRLLQGDVGSGKTVVAALAMAQAAEGGYQSALMAPTEILAGQHFRSISGFFAGSDCAVACLTGGAPAAERRRILQATASGEIDILVGTHALIGEKLTFNRLGLIVIDEQHRFGVRQRTSLSQKGESPNVLVMSATPIPRTLALILYGDLDISIVDELPPGRTPVRTRVVPEHKRDDMYGFIKKKVAEGRQAYVVCPLVEDSEAVDAKSAEEVFEYLKTDKLKDLRVALAHGKMRPREKEAALEMFRAGETDVLVSTTVIEVGVNVPNASIMVIENAERFGLAQLHQLRGRVGRASYESWCFLMAEQNERLALLTRTRDGFIIAEKDMQLRGPGELFGLRQTGAADGIGALMGDSQLLKDTHDEARAIIENPDSPESVAVIALARENFARRMRDVAMN